MEEKIDLNLIELSERKIDTLKKIPTEKQINPGLIDKNKASGFKKVNINNIADLVRFFPKKYIERELITNISELDSKDNNNDITIAGRIEDISVFVTKTRLRITTFKINDDSGILSAKWFGAQYVERRFQRGESVFLTGKCNVKKNGAVEIKNPYIELNDYDFSKEDISFIPIYQKVPNSSPSWIRKKLREIFDKTNAYDSMPLEIQKKYNLINRKKAYEKIHFPLNLKESQDARKRLVVDEFMYLQSFFHKSKEMNKANKLGIKHKFEKKNLDNFRKNLDFTLTESQEKVINEIVTDMESEVPMKRLLQGDVGSGKTVVAAYAMLSVVLNGYQASFMAPTEVLAEQHFKTIEGMCDTFEIEIFLITSSKDDKSEIQEIIKNGRPAIFIGTHALIQEKIEFNNLSFVVIDETHRFGVEQRSKLSSVKEGMAPDILYMSATPIPRTTALTVYGDLELSVIDELPKGRLPIFTQSLDGLAGSKSEINNIVQKHIDNQSQIFVVCPFIDESEKLDIKAAESVYVEYKNNFQSSKVQILHGRMDSSQKDKIMTEIKAGSIDILVSTVVIEVGIDIENASLMIIESAERFGLSQLHQLRGRVGRGKKQSECILHLSEGKKLDTITEEGRHRIEAAVSTTDGFEIAEFDFQIRGEGTVLGGKQSGTSEMKIANLRIDGELLLTAQDIFNDPDCNNNFKESIYEEANIFLPHYKKLFFG